jgi:uncharacterized protein YdhG (YjbR/CyaY superfamily)
MRGPIMRLALGQSDRFPKELMKYAAAKGTLQFPIGRALPADAIGRLVKARAREKDTKLAHDAGSGKRAATVRGTPTN